MNEGCDDLARLHLAMALFLFVATLMGCMEVMI